MQRSLLLFLLTCSFCLQVSAQSAPSHRARFRYIITQDKINSLQKGTPSIIITDTVKREVLLAYKLCEKDLPKYLGIFKRSARIRTLITNDKGTLLLDPWSIENEAIDTNQGANQSTDPCLNEIGVINAATQNVLRIQLPKRPLIGNPTITTTLHYQTWLFGINTTSLKIRPKTKNDKDSTYAKNISAGTFSLGLNVGYSFGWTTFSSRSSASYSITPGFNLGFSALSLSKEPLKRRLTADLTPNNFVLSPAFSLIVARNDLGIILTMGQDHMYGNNSNAWLYQDKLFFGLGVSAGLKL